MNHGLILPILLPFIAGIALLLLGETPAARWRLDPRRLSLGSVALLLPVALLLLARASSGAYATYALGHWPAPFGILLVLDRCSALLLLLVALIALAALLHALTTDSDRQGRWFHPLFQFQLMGLNGAFLAGDLFNLFVFFEILLIASYGLLLHGGGAARLRAGLHYVILNLAGSALFLIAIATLYGTTGALNFADLAQRIATAPAETAALLRVGALLLLVVFGLKAAILPLYCWLPAAYASSSAPVAALFALLTKVGVYAIVRIATLLFGSDAGPAAQVLAPWLLPLGLATLLAGALGMLASAELRRLLAYGVIVSIGTLLIGLGLDSSAGLGAALVYLVHTTLIGAGMFLLADLIAAQRGHLDHRPAAPLAQPALLGGLFLAGAIAMAGLPPLSGFFGKLLLLRAATDSATLPWVWGGILGSGLLVIIALSRSGSALFWLPATTATVNTAPAPIRQWLPAAALLTTAPLLILFGQPLLDFATATAQQLREPAGYIHAVLGDPAVATVALP